MNDRMIFLKNLVVKGSCPLTIPLEKVRFFRAGAVCKNGKPAVIAYFNTVSYTTLASFETQEEAAEALSRLEAEIAHTFTKIKPYSAEFIEAERWVNARA